MNALDLRGVTVDGARVLECVGVQPRANGRRYITWRCECACGREFLATTEHIRKVQDGAHDRHRMRCGTCKVDLTPRVHRWTADEWIAIVNAIVEWARVVRRRYLDFECDACGATYHPRHGRKPPRERRAACGHAHFREAHQYWDRARDDWREDA